MGLVYSWNSYCFCFCKFITPIKEYKDKKVASVVLALTKFEQLTWQEVAKRFGRKQKL